MYVQFGCGFDAPKEWINFDASPTLRIERIPLIGRMVNKNNIRFPRNVKYGDVVRGLPITSNSCDGVYASHVLEHLSRNDFTVALNETKRILKPGGIFRIIVPDLKIICNRYIDSLKSGNSSANHEFMKAANLGKEVRDRSWLALLVGIFGNSAHLWMWDEKSIAEQLKNLGFIDIRRAYFNDCEDEMFEFVEREDRFEDACAIEARRPN